MKFRLNDLTLTFRGGREVIEFAGVNYFYGQMGAGKSSLARLIDFCLGGGLELTAALQSEFVSASLSLEVAEQSLTLTRAGEEDVVLAEWVDDGPRYLRLPARKPAGVVLPGTEVEVLSDLVFHLAGMNPPRVRKSKVKEDSELARLSIRDLFWYCYLDQDSIDSSFFHLDDDANPFKRLKSRDVLRFLVGFHQEHVAELEANLELKRADRLKLEAAAVAMGDLLKSTGFEDSLELSKERNRLIDEVQKIQAEIKERKADLNGLLTHGTESIRDSAKRLDREIQEITQSISEIRETIWRDKAHRNELLALATKARRSISARAVLRAVEFLDCPRCSQKLPPRDLGDCHVCGQPEPNDAVVVLDDEIAERDVRVRVEELTDVLDRYEVQLARFERRLRDAAERKRQVDLELSRASENYDSAYLSTVLELEKERAALGERIHSLSRLETIADRAFLAKSRVVALLADEQQIRSDLKAARARAERDTKNIEILKDLFLDCLVRSKVAGFLPDDHVEMRSPNFLPEVMPAGVGDLVVTSFANLGSGGKKTLYKCCFAVAIHRLAARIGAMLPELLIVDSPMKNISERENREQFEGFHEMLYELSQSELAQTQFILIDKEWVPPPDEFSRSFQVRHMKPDDDAFPPLIRYYRGK